MDVEELNIRRIAAVNPSSYYRKFVYVEADADQPTDLYPVSDEIIADRVGMFGYADEEYGLVDGKLPVTIAEYDDGAALIDGKPVDIRGRVELRLRFITPYNFLIAPFASPINNNLFDDRLVDFMNRLLQGEDAFDEMLNEIFRLPKRH